MATSSPNPLLHLRGVGALARGGLGALAGGAQRAGSTLSTGTSGLASDFAALLRQAQGGEVSSGLSVNVSPRVKVDLSSEQLARLSSAADRAEAAGLTRAVAMIDGRALIMEVQTRTISAEISGGEPVLSGIDGVINVPPGEGAAEGDVLGPPGAGLSAPVAPLASGDRLRALLQRARGG